MSSNVSVKLAVSDLLSPPDFTVQREDGPPRLLEWSEHIKSLPGFMTTSFTGSPDKSREVQNNWPVMQNEGE